MKKITDFASFLIVGVLIFVAACEKAPDEEINIDQNVSDVGDDAISGLITPGPEFDLMTTPVGTVNFPNSCEGEAEGMVERGIGLMHHMMYEEADFVFTMAMNEDPDCALSYWGQAMAIIHPLWPDQPSVTELQRGLSLVEKSLALGGG